MLPRARLAPLVETRPLLVDGRTRGGEFTPPGNSQLPQAGESSPECLLALTFPTLCGFDSQARDPVEVTIRSHDEMTTTNVVRHSVQGLHGLLGWTPRSSKAVRAPWVSLKFLLPQEQ